MTRCNYAACHADIATPEDAVYDERTSAYYCDSGCWHGWADDNFEEVTEYYARQNVSGG